MIVHVSESLPQEALFVVTQDGANIGREPDRPLKYQRYKSVKEASITYNTCKQCFTVRGKGSTNGMFQKEAQ